MAGEGEHWFFDAMHGSTVKGASNAEPHLRMDSGIAALETLGIADEGSFSASKNECCPSSAFHYSLFLLLKYLDHCR